jgi:pyruvate,orthophosphate dikinase
VRANANSPQDARRACEFGAEGIGLCRTEHMFVAGDRQSRMRALIMADTEEERRAVLAELLPLQQGDFEELLEAMERRPVCIRLLDPPLHEFLPDRAALQVEIERAPADGGSDLDELERTLARVRALEEVNPMLGTRGARLGLLHPEVYEMQVQAIMRATRAVRERTGQAPHLEVMIPLVVYARELEVLRELVIRLGHEEGLEHPRDFSVGTMIELPRSCTQAEQIAAHADFFSFGTNDLTQTALGFSRDDTEGRITDRYVELGVFDRSPFETIDGPGVGALLRMGASLGRKANHGLKLGVCGEHGGDPDSIDFFHHAGLDYVSCSPYRVPIARVAAAQAAVRAGSRG